MNQHTSLRVHRRLLSVVVRPVKELAPRRIHRGQERQSLFDGFPLRHRVDAHAFTRETRQVETRAVLLFNVTPKKARHFQPALGIDSCRVVPAKHCDWLRSCLRTVLRLAPVLSSTGVALTTSLHFAPPAHS